MTNRGVVGRCRSWSGKLSARLSRPLPTTLMRRSPSGPSKEPKGVSESASAKRRPVTANVV
ncbi:MAG TPA: hypothetical protein VFT74_15795 [Isosphaeraceae bacterium]|nr:hypothetical protein [Isosphaeraceae bacterium]